MRPPEAAVGFCGEGLALPGVYKEQALHSKLLARKMEAHLQASRGLQLQSPWIIPTAAVS